MPGIGLRPHTHSAADGGLITAAGLASNAVETAKVAADAITYAKIQNVSAASRVLGRGSAGGAGDVEELTLGTGLSMAGTVLSATGGGGTFPYPVSATEANVQAELDALTPGTTFVLKPNATYPPFEIPGGITVVGGGPGTIITGTGVVGAIVEIGTSTFGSAARVRLQGVRITGTADYGLRLDGATFCAVRDVEIAGDWDNDGCRVLNTFGTIIENINTDGSTYNDAASADFSFGSNWAAGQANTLYTSSLGVPYNFYFHSASLVIAGVVHLNNCAQGGRIGFYFGHQIEDISMNGYTENVVIPISLGISGTAIPHSVKFFGGVFGGPLDTHPSYADRIACIHHNDGVGTAFYGAAFPGCYGVLSPVTVTFTGGTAGAMVARAVAVQKRDGSLSHVTVTERGAYTVVPTGATIGGAVSGATVTVQTSVLGVDTVTVTGAGTGTPPGALLLCNLFNGEVLIDKPIGFALTGLFDEFWAAVVRVSGAESSARCTITNGGFRRSASGDDGQYGVGHWQFVPGGGLAYGHWLEEVGKSSTAAGAVGTIPRTARFMPLPLYTP